MKRKKLNHKKAPGNHSRSTLFQYSIMGGIVLSALTLSLSLWVYCSPDSVKRVFAAMAAEEDKVTQEETAKAPPSPEEPPPMITPSGEMGRMSDLTLDNAGNQEDFIYSVMLDTVMGPMLYYNQGDSRWGDYPYGGKDPLKKYGCGPTAVSMLINSFSPAGASVTPVELADWAAANGYYAPQSGSYHSIIPDSLNAFGFQVESVRDRSEGRARELLQTGHILAALMGAGSLTDNGHFILITSLQEDGTVLIADPNSLDNSSRSWDLKQLMGELKKSYDSGGPLWAVSLPASPAP